jgi:hypothetical protein
MIRLPSFHVDGPDACAAINVDAISPDCCQERGMPIVTSSSTVKDRSARDRRRPSRLLYQDAYGRDFYLHRIERWKFSLVPGYKANYGFVSCGSELLL